MPENNIAQKDNLSHPHAEAAVDGEMLTPVSNQRLLWIGLVLGGFFLLLATTTTLVLYFALHKDPTAAAVEWSDSASDTGDPPSAKVPPPPLHPVETRRDEPPLLSAPAAVPTDVITQPEQVSWVPPEEPERVDKAIDRGLKWLMNNQNPNGGWSRDAHSVGLAAFPR